KQEIILDVLHELASTSLGGDTTVEAAYTIYKASHDAHASSDAGHDEDEEKIFAVEDTIPAGDGIPADAQTIPTGSTPIPTTRGVSASSFIDPAGQATADAPSSSTIPAADKGKAPMANDSIPANVLTEQEREVEFARQQEELAQKAQAKSVSSPVAQGDDVNEDNMNERLGMLFMRKRRKLAEQSWVPASVPAAPSIAADVSVSAVSTTTTDVSPAPTLPVESVAEVHANESGLDENQTASKQVSTEHTESDDDPSPYAPYVGWEMVPTPLGFIHAYYYIEEHTKHFTSLRELLHMVEKNDLRKLLGDVDTFYQRQEPDTFALILWGDLRVLFQSLADEDAHAFWHDQESWRIRSWRFYPRPHVHVLETVD
nr:hypothetical protein [Tanacetum cinerariifolium]